ncbi:MAG: class I tRNA ligase family protein, partial [Patescibacteria group bacterium]
FMPFVTEAIWKELGEEKLLIIESWPEPNKKWNYSDSASEMKEVMAVVSAIRSMRSEAHVDATKKIHATLLAHDKTELLENKKSVIIRMANLESCEIHEKGKKLEKALSAFVGNIEIYLPLADLVDLDKEKARIEKEITQLSAYKKTLDQKLKNKTFVGNAPKEVIDKEKGKLEDTDLKLKKLQNQLNTFSG